MRVISHACSGVCVEFAHLATLSIDSLSYPLKRPLWDSIYTSEFSRSAAMADVLFAEHYMHSTQECPNGFLLATIFRLIPFAISDREGWVERFTHVIMRQIRVLPEVDSLVHEYTNLLNEMRENHAYTIFEKEVIFRIIKQADTARTVVVFGDKCFPGISLVVTSSCVGVTLCLCVSVLFPVLAQLKYLVMLALGPRSFVYTETGLDDVKPFIATADIAVPREYHTDALLPWMIAVRDPSTAEYIAQGMVDWYSHLQNWFPVENQGLETLLEYRPSTVWISGYSDNIGTSWMSDTRSVDVRVIHPNSVSCLGGKACHERYRAVWRVHFGSHTLLLESVSVVSYADGCCVQSQVLNTQTALAAGASHVFAKSRLDLDFEFVSEFVLPILPSRGAGYWIWKPRVILDSLVSLDDDVLVYLDAGNHFVWGSSIVEFANEVLQFTDVAAPMLSCCIEGDWSKRDLARSISSDQAIWDSGQVGSFFILIRKESEIAKQFIHEWLKLCTNHHLLTDTLSRSRNSPTFVQHTHDQSIFSVLFKKYGFQSFSIERALKHVVLSKWRE